MHRIKKEHIGITFVAIPPFVALYCLLNIYEDYFFWEEWNLLVGLSMYVFHRNPYAWQVLWEPHFGHRLVLLKLLSVANFQLFAGNQLPLLLFAWTTQVIALAVALRRIMSVNGMRTLSRHAMMFSVSAIAFSPKMMVAWVWPVCIQHLLTSTLFCVSLSQIGRISQGGGIVSPIALAVLCTISSGNGVVVWPAIVALGLLVTIPKRLLLLALASGAVTLGTMFYGLPIVAAGERTTTLLERMKYVVAFVGSPLDFNVAENAVALGTGGLVVYLSLWIVAIRHRDVEMFVDLSWGWLTLASAIAGACFRIGLGGMEQALLDRYVPLVVPFWLSVVLSTVRFVACLQLQRAKMVVVLTITSVACAVTIFPYISSEAIDPEAFEGSSHAYVRLASDALKEGVFVTSSTNPYVNLFPDPNGVLGWLDELKRNSVGLFRDKEWRSRKLGSQIQSWGNICSSCDVAGTVSYSSEPFGDIDPQRFGFDKGRVIFGHLAVQSSTIRDVLIVDSAGRVVGLGFPIGQFRNGIDFTELLFWKPRRWIGFVSDGHLLGKRAEKAMLSAFVRMRKTDMLIPLQDMATSVDPSGSHP
jgi:hypothetical protein